jgi:archaellum biogenesis ATPase FlaH
VNAFIDQKSQFSVKIVCTDIVKSMLEDCTIKAKFKTVCYAIDPKVNSEIAIKLLEQMLTLYVRLHTYSFEKDVREKHKAAKRQSKKRSLRTEIKQASSSTDGGH